LELEELLVRGPKTQGSSSQIATMKLILGNPKSVEEQAIDWRKCVGQPNATPKVTSTL